MNLNTLRKYTDIVMFFVMCFLAGTGLLMHYRLVPGYRGGQGLTLLGLSRHEWGDYHLWAAYLLIALVAVHVTIDFSFVKNIIAAKRKWMLFLLGLAGLIIVLALLIVPIERTEGGGGRGPVHGGEHLEGLPEEHGGGQGQGQGQGLGHGRGQGQGRGQGRGQGQGYGPGRIDSNN